MLLRTYLNQPRYAQSHYAMNNYPFALMQRLLDEESTGVCAAKTAATSPKMSLRLDVKEDDKAYHVQADLPGLSDKEVEVSFEEGTLTIKGEKKVARDEKSDTWHITERTHGGFSRKLALPHAVDMEKIEAKFDKGVLTVTLPKTEPAKPTARKIDVKFN